MTSSSAPFVGPRSYRVGERLYGRDTEVEQLLDLLIASRVVLLYSPSGAGKTSLVQAGLIPRLVEERFNVLPIIRIDRPPPAAVAGAASPPNRYLASALGSLEDGRAEAERLPAAELADLDLASYLDRTRPDGEAVIVLDQFETLLTTDAGDREAKEAFLVGLAAAVRDPRTWVLIVLREEFVPALDPYLYLLPTRLSARMRLELLDEERARAAIQQPAEDAGVTITRDAATRLVTDLRRVTEQGDDGTEVTLLGTVEPVQLQVVCLRLWQQLQPEVGAVIDVDMLPPTSGVDDALADYYGDAMARIAAATHVPEMQIREWFERQLITQHGGRSVRTQVRDGIPAAVRAACEDAYLVRSDERSGVRWYELSHDRLIGPIRSSNAAWLRANASAFQLRARAWDDSLRNPSLLLRGRDLTEGRRWTAGQPLSGTEKDFLEQSEEARRQERKVRVLAQANALLLFAVVVGVALIGVLVVIQRRSNDQQQVIGLTSAAADLLDRRPDVAMRLAAEAYTISAEPDTGRALLNTVRCCQPQLSALVTSDMGRATGVAFDPSGSQLVSVYEDGSVRVHDLGSGDVRPLLTTEPAAGDPSREPRNRLTGAYAVAWQPVPDGLIAVGDGEGAVWMVDPSSGVATQLSRPHVQRVTSLAFTDDGSTLVSASADGTVAVWRAPFTAGSMASVLPTSYDGAISDVAVSPSGRYVVATAAAKDHELIFWDRAIEHAPGLIVPTPGNAITVAFTDEVDPRVVVGLVGKLDVLRVVPVAPIGASVPSWQGPLDAADAEVVRDIALGPTGLDGTRIAIGLANGVISTDRLVVTGATSPVRLIPGSQLLQVGDVPIERLTWSPDGSRLAAGDQSGTLSLWLGDEPADVHRHGGKTLAVHAPGAGQVSAVFDDGSRLDGVTDSDIVPGGPLQVTAATISDDGTAVGIGTRHGGLAVRIGDEPVRFLVREPEPTPEPPPGPAPSASSAATPDDLASITSVAFDATHTHLASTNKAGLVRIWDLAPSQPRPTIVGVVGPGTSLRAVYDPSGQYLIVSRCLKLLGKVAPNCSQSQVDWLRTDNGTIVASIPAINGFIQSLAVDPQHGTDVAIGTKPGSLELYRFDPGAFRPAPLRLIKLDARGISALAFVPGDPPRLAVGTDSGLVRLLDPATLTVLVDGVSGARGGITALAASPDGTELVVGAADGTVQRLPLSQAAVLARACSLTRWVSDETVAPFMDRHPLHPCPTLLPGG